jgi:hypothetical protein
MRKPPRWPRTPYMHTARPSNIPGPSSLTLRDMLLFHKHLLFLRRHLAKKTIPDPAAGPFVLHGRGELCLTPVAAGVEGNIEELGG